MQQLNFQDLVNFKFQPLFQSPANCRFLQFVQYPANCRFQKFFQRASNYRFQKNFQCPPNCRFPLSTFASSFSNYPTPLVSSLQRCHAQSRETLKPYLRTAYYKRFVNRTRNFKVFSIKESTFEHDASEHEVRGEAMLSKI